MKGVQVCSVAQNQCGAQPFRIAVLGGGDSVLLGKFGKVKDILDHHRLGRLCYCSLEGKGQGCYPAHGCQ